MKTKEELNVLKEAVEALNRKLAELNEEELAQVSGGIAPGRDYWRGRRGQNKEKSLNDDDLNIEG